MKDAEKKQRAGEGRRAPVEITVAKDGLSVYVNDSDPLNGAERRPAQADFHRQGRQLESSWAGRTPDYSLLAREHWDLRLPKEHVLQNADYTPRAQGMPGTAAVVNAVVKEKFGIGYGGAAYAKGIKVLEIKKDAASKAIAPEDATIKNGTYPLSRPLFFYVLANPLAEIKTLSTGCCRPRGRGLSPRCDISPSNSLDTGTVTELVPAMFRRRHEFEAAGSPTASNLGA